MMVQWRGACWNKQCASFLSRQWPVPPPIAKPCFPKAKETVFMYVYIKYIMVALWWWALNGPISVGLLGVSLASCVSPHCTRSSSSSICVHLFSTFARTPCDYMLVWKFRYLYIFSYIMCIRSIFPLLRAYFELVVCISILPLSSKFSVFIAGVGRIEESF